MLDCFPQFSSENENMIKGYEVIFYLLGVSYIEIRTAKDLEDAHIIADIFHNIPAMISIGRSVEYIKTEMLRKAIRHGLEKKIRQLIDHAERRGVASAAD